MEALFGIEPEPIGHVLLVTEDLAFLDARLARDTHHAEIGEMHEDGGQIIGIGFVPAP